MNNGAASIPGWYVEFQANMLRQLPRPGEIDPTTAEGWNRNQKALKKALTGVLLPTEREEEHVIDCDANPFVPEGWTVEDHQKGGQFKWVPAKIKLFFSRSQRNGTEAVYGNELRKELAGKPVLNANVLDYLLAHPHLIPKEWEGKRVFFWGTIYRDKGPHDDLYVRYLDSDYGSKPWHGSHFWLNPIWIGYGLAALRAD